MTEIDVMNGPEKCIGTSNLVYKDLVKEGWAYFPFRPAQAPEQLEAAKTPGFTEKV